MRPRLHPLMPIGTRRLVWGLVSTCLVACRPSLFDDLAKGHEAVASDARPPFESLDGEAESAPAPSMDAMPEEKVPPGDEEIAPPHEPRESGPADSTVPREAGEPDTAVLPPGLPEAGVLPEAAINAAKSDAQEASAPEAAVEPQVCLGTANPSVCGCHRDCEAYNARGVCVMGRCERKCPQDFDDCNQDLGTGVTGDGCETDLRTNDASCNACGQRCTTEHARFVGCEARLCRPLDVTPRQLRVFDRCLDVEGPYLGNGHPAQIWSCGDHLPQQEWAETTTGELRGFENKCLDVRGPFSDNGTAVQTWDCVRAPQQTWTLNEKGQLVGFAGKCLQVKDGVDADGQDVELFDCLDIPAQRWRWVAP
jgi:Ricin-type beta-trefoil lectin domain